LRSSTVFSLFLGRRIGLELALSALGTLSCFGQVTLRPGAPVVIDAAEPSALQKAAQDLARDLERVLGRPSPLLRAAPSPPHIRICFERPCPDGVERPRGIEVLRIRPQSGAVVLTGSDLRGAIYAIYEFAERFLGVEPLHYWVDQEPPRRSQVVISTEVTSGPPTFRYRGWFINDEDLLSGWKPGGKEGGGIALECWDKIFEALLRLKGNMIVPGTFIFPDEPQVRAAGERGLIITQHHIEVLGTNTYRWPEDKPYSFGLYPDLLARAWRNSIRGYPPHQEVIWTLGYRGKHDRPFWDDDPSVGPSDAERARAIRAAIDKQIELLQAERPGAYMLMNAWQEAVPFLRAGLLELPRGVTLVWPDNGHGIIRDEGTIRSGQGVYYHTAMLNFAANQLTEMVPLERIQRELGRAVRAGATEYLLINTSDLRPVPLTTQAAMELAWNAGPWLLAGEQAVQRYLEHWCERQFGPQAAPHLADYYRAYFAAPGRYGPAEHQTLADNAYHTFARYMLVSLITGNRRIAVRHFGPETDFSEFVRRVGGAAREAEPRWQRARALAQKAAPAIPKARRTFFLAHVETQLAVHEHSNRMLRQVAAAYESPEAAGRIPPLRAAIDECQAVLQALGRAEYGKWVGFYRNEVFVDVRHTLRLLQAALAQAEGRPLPADAVILHRPQDPYVLIKSYQGFRRVSVE
jgi:hypothetical protein